MVRMRTDLWMKNLYRRILLQLFKSCFFLILIITQTQLTGIPREGKTILLNDTQSFLSFAKCVHIRLNWSFAKKIFTFLLTK